MPPSSTSSNPSPKHPPVLSRLLSGSFWLALRTPIQVVCTLWTTRLLLEQFPQPFAAYGFAWGFGFFQFLLEFGISSSLQRRVSECWTHGDRDGINRAIACGMGFYAAMALVQVAVLMGIAYLAVPHSAFSSPELYPLVVKLLWLQAITAPCYGMSVVISSVLQAARRYAFIPKLEVLVVIERFVILLIGVQLRWDFFLIIVLQTVVQIGFTLCPALWVMVRELGYTLHFQGARRADYLDLLHFSAYVFLIQLSIVLADKIDTTILGFALSEDAATTALQVYLVVSKPFAQIRQTGWMLSYMVMPAVASLAAAHDVRGLDRLKYDGPRLHTGALLPVALLAAIYAAPFLSLLFGKRLPGDAGDYAWLMQLFLIATLPLLISVHVQIAIGTGRIRLIALSALVGSLVNLPISCALTLRFGDVSGVIWGTVVTTLFSNLLVPAVYVFRVLEVNPFTYLVRTLSAPVAGGLALLSVTWITRLLIPIPASGPTSNSSPTVLFVTHLAIGSLAYVIGYVATPTGRGDLVEILGKLRAREVL